MSNKDLIARIKACEICAHELPLPPKPIVQFHPNAKILIAGQAPGIITHEKGIPFDDASGDRLRHWMGVDRTTFYDANKIAIVPMGFCYPCNGKSGDLPPRKECAEHWQAQIHKELKNIEFKLVIGQYAQAWHLEMKKKNTVTDIVKQWQRFLPGTIPLPHPSPRNNIWLKRNPWFEEELIPVLQQRIKALLNDAP